MDNQSRTDDYQQSAVLEQLLQKINGMLEAPELDAIGELTRPKLPVVCIVGNPRSGTTLLYQWLAASGLFAYPSNIMSRFYNAPYIGGLIHKIFVEHDKFGELCGNRSIEFQSKLGKTKDAHSPHEFWYFWRRFFNFGKIQQLSEAQLAKCDHELFLKELAALEHCFKKPLLFKALIMNWNLDYLHRIMGKPLFIHIKRSALHNMASLLKARMLFFNDPQKWYSFKPPEYEYLKNKDMYTQLAGQVCYTNQYIETTLKRMPPDHSITISYEQLCHDPQEYNRLIRSRLSLLGYHTKTAYDGPDAFKPSLNILDTFDVSKAEKALACVQATLD